MKGRFYKPAAWANLSVPVLAVHWVRVPCLPNPSARTSPARDGFEKFPLCVCLDLGAKRWTRNFSSGRISPEIRLRD
jgi:hypothetical protein